MRIFTSEACHLHEVPGFFPERPDRLVGILTRLEETGWPIDNVSTHSAARRTTERIHDTDYLERFEQAVASGVGWLDTGDNPISEGTWEAAWGSVAATLTAVDSALTGDDRLAFAAVRPPGHHAEHAFAMGFCYLNNVAVAAEHALMEHGLERVAILDFDVHHGNGTQHLFEPRGDVLYASCHQWPFYPGSGAEDEQGVGEGRGATVNVPLPAGSGDEAYRKAFRNHLLPALREFAPDLLLVSAGYDAWRGDPLGGMRVSADGFRDWGRMLGELAAQTCAGRVVATLEGGYDLGAVPDLVAVSLEGLQQGTESS